jgi:positive regulator of sigma E activity
MTWLQLLAQAAVFATILGFFIIVVAFLNSRHYKDRTSKDKRDNKGDGREAYGDPRQDGEENA